MDHNRERLRDGPVKPRASLRNVTFAGLLITLGAASFYVSRATTRGTLAKTPLSATPFVLQWEYYSFEEDPEGRLVKKETVAQRLDGTRVRVASAGPLTWGVSIRQIRFPGGRVLSIADSIRAKTTWPASREGVSDTFSVAFPAKPEGCVSPGWILVRKDTVQGLEVSVVSSAPPGHERIIDWRAPALGCASIKYQSEAHQSDGSYKLAIESRIVSLDLVEPDPSLFDEGRDYEEVKPSELQRRLLTSQGVTQFSEGRLENWGRHDARYFGQH
jgi:hypothetical protein